VFLAAAIAKQDDRDQQCHHRLVKGFLLLQVHRFTI
jgi:hypothetical protein